MTRTFLPIVVALLAACGAAHAERADREKDIVLVADKGVGDDAKKTSTFEGNVVVTQGTMRITAEKVTLTEKDNFKYYVALGSPVTFRQKRDNVDEWIEGFADRAEFDDRSDVVKLFKRAKVKSSQNELTGEFISYDMRSEVAEVLGAPPGEKANPKGTPPPRVKMIIVPQKAGEKPGEKPGEKAPAKAAAPKGEPLTLRSDTEMK